MFRQLITKSVRWFVQYATEPEDSEELKIKKTIAISVSFTATLLWLGYAVLYYVLGEQQAAIVSFAATIIFAFGLFIYKKYISFIAFVYYDVCAQVIFISLVHIALGGFAQSGMVIVWVIMLPLLMIVIFTPKQGIYWALLAATDLIVLALFQPSYFRPANNISTTVLTILYVMNILGSNTMAVLAVYYYVWQNQILSGLLSEEQKKTESLLLNILPKEIAAILKNESHIIADYHENATVLFADMVNFTPMSAKMMPKEIVELLNDVFSYFDTLAEKYGLEKIKTIGDCYMVAAGAPRSRVDHAHVLTQFALDIRNYLNQNEFNGRKLAFRVGLHSGPLVAGVIGRKKFIYDLWGDTVNTASRMESHGSGGFIQITEATYNLIKDDYVCESHGKVNVKGKGEIDVWYVVDGKES